MRKFAFIFLLAVSLSGKSQIGVVEYNPKTVCPGDSIDVTFSGQPHQFWFHIWTVNWFVAVVVDPEGNEDLFTRRFEIPGFFEGECWIAAEAKRHLLLLDCETTGLPEARTQADFEPAVYFDLTGNQVSPSEGELLIEFRGKSRRKVVFTPGR